MKVFLMIPKILLDSEKVTDIKRQRREKGMIMLRDIGTLRRGKGMIILIDTQSLIDI